MATCCTNADGADNTIDPPIVVGSSRAFEGLVVDGEGQPYDLTAARGYMTARRRIEDPEPLIYKRTSNAGGATTEFLILDQVVDNAKNKGRYRFFLMPADTRNLNHKEVIKYDVKFVLPTGEHKVVVRSSNMPLGPAITR